MPLLRYFGFAGSALALLLFGLSWYFPQPVSEPVRSGIDGPVIRISSVEQLPERVDIDTSLPTIVPENEEASITSAIGVRHGLPPLSPPSVLEFSERWPVANTVEANPRPRPTPPNAGDGVPKKQSLVKRGPVKKIVTHRAAPTVNNEPAPSISVQAATPVTRMSLLDLLKERLGQTLFKLN
jgi:hypothetical protein